MASDADVDCSLSRKYINAHAQVSNQLIFSGKRQSKCNFYQTTKHVWKFLGSNDPIDSVVASLLPHTQIWLMRETNRGIPGTCPGISVIVCDFRRCRKKRNLGCPWVLNFLVVCCELSSKKIFFLVSMSVKWNFPTVGRLEKLFCQPSEKGPCLGHTRHEHGTHLTGQ